MFTSKVEQFMQYIFWQTAQIILASTKPIEAEHHPQVLLWLAFASVGFL